MCLVSSSVKSLGSMRPVLVTRVLKGPGAAENGATQCETSDGVTGVSRGVVDRITSQWECVKWHSCVPQPRL